MLSFFKNVLVPLNSTLYWLKKGSSSSYSKLNIGSIGSSTFALYSNL